MNFRNDRVLLVGAVVFLFCVLVEVIWLLWAGSHLVAERRSLQDQHRQLVVLQGRARYPSDQNVEVLREVLDELEFSVGEYGAELKEDPFLADETEATEFSARAQNRVEHFQRRAELGGVKLLEAREAGFEKYTQGGVIPESKYVARLSRQLYSMERVADILVEAGVESIDRLSRDVFEDVTGEATKSRTRRSRRNAVDSNAVNKVDLEASDVHPDRMYFIEQIGVEFVAREALVWAVLKSFESAPHFMAVSEFRHKTVTDILSYNPDAVKRGTNGDSETLKFLEKGVLVGDQARSRTERQIAGDELIRVQLLVDVYNFDPKGAR